MFQKKQLNVFYCWAYYHNILQMRFYIKTIAGTTIVVRDIEGSETILELKRRIYEQAEIPIELQRLIFAGIVSQVNFA